MTIAECFPPVADHRSRILILGSMPGKASLNAGQYYAHPHNAFWKIMGDLVAASQQLPYEARLGILRLRGIALWDVLASCTRAGSLDSAIDAESIAPNDLGAFLDQHPSISHVFFNGAMAESCFLKRVLPLAAVPPVVCRRLPSTSPAHASMTYQQKLAAWKVIMPHIDATICAENHTVTQTDSMREEVVS